jgi:hypothetical protein
MDFFLRLYDSTSQKPRFFIRLFQNMKRQPLSGFAPDPRQFCQLIYQIAKGIRITAAH